MDNIDDIIDFLKNLGTVNYNNFINNTFDESVIILKNNECDHFKHENKSIDKQNCRLCKLTQTRIIEKNEFVNDDNVPSYRDRLSDHYLFKKSD